MNGDEKEEAQRPRPLSGGIWTLFSWLRRSERSSSSESLSSGGSARTAASFDFLSPGNYSFTNPPVVLTPLGAPTDSYKKRLQDRNLRRLRDRDITLHRKYGLFRGYGAGYDGFSLPPARRALANTVDRQNRDRRAASECLQRRAAYVPGKRRAPLPPALTTSASLPRSNKRKRQAPKPPLQTQQNIKPQNNQPSRMNSKSGYDERITDNDKLTNNPEKCDKKSTHSKDTKLKSEKSFLKQIFENRKRNSAIETTSVRLLPSISELDRQAAEIIEINKLRHNRNDISSAHSTSHYEGNVWFCTSCLRKYDASVEACIYCQFDEAKGVRNVSQNSSNSIHKPLHQYNIASSSQTNLDEQKLLKEILKEMKDSLPKRSKGKANVLVTETPTLRIGSTPAESKSAASSSKQTIASTSSHGLSPMKDKKQNISKAEENVDINHNIKEIPFSKKLTDCLEINVTQRGTSLAFKSNAPTSISSQISEKGTGSSSKHVLSQTSSFPSSSFKEKSKTGDITQDKRNVNSYRVQNNQNKESSCHDRISELQRVLIRDDLNSDPNIIKPNRISTHFEEPHPELSKPELTNYSVNVERLSNSGQEIKQSNKNSDPSTKVLFEEKIEKPNSSKDFHFGRASQRVAISSGLDAVTSAKQSNFLKPSSDQKDINSAKIISVSPTQVQSKEGQIKSSQSSIITFQTESSLHTPLKISSLLNPLYSPRISALHENNTVHKQLRTEERLPQSDNNNKTITKPHVDKKEEIENLTKNDQNLNVASTIAELIKTKKNEEKVKKPRDVATKPLETAGLNKEVHTKKRVDKFEEILCAPSTSKCSNIGATTSNNTDKADHYNRRRRLINQLEQSIATGDENAAAEAAANLAKLRLACSVLSFSSQIVAECLKQTDTNILIDTQNKTIQSSTNNDLNIQNETKKNAVPEGKDKKAGKVINNANQLSEIKEVKETPGSTAINLQSSSTQTANRDIVSIEVSIEDKQAARDPIRLRIPRRATVRDLRNQVERSLGLDARLQRWIVGRNLCTNDDATIISLAGSDFSAPFYLCLVQTETNIKQENHVNNDCKANENHNQNGSFYTELIKLEQQALVPNIEPFECEVCMEECAAGGGVILRECIHTFCRDCLSDAVRHCEEPVVSCPATGCSGFIQDREIRSLMSPEDYDRWLARSLATAESGTRNAFHCRTRDCLGWAYCEPGVRRFPCPVCKHTNCVPCQAIHEGDTCEQYQEKLRNAVTAAETNKADEGTQALINSLLSRGEALECPECHAIITKKWGCDWVKCSACKTEICWVTKGRRWGPGGRGDTSGGCRCGVEGKKCHPSCGYCH